MLLDDAVAWPAEYREDEIAKAVCEGRASPELLAEGASQGQGPARPEGNG
ncbi:MAG: hypothetical protein ACREXW_09080 [Gammaproteobacteria bacterium]